MTRHTVGQGTVHECLFSGWYCFWHCYQFSIRCPCTGFIPKLVSLSLFCALTRMMIFSSPECSRLMMPIFAAFPPSLQMEVNDIKKALQSKWIPDDWGVTLFTLSPRLKSPAPAKIILCQKIKGLPQHVPVWMISTKVLIAQHKFHPRGDSFPWCRPGSGSACDLWPIVLKAFLPWRSPAKWKLRQFSP